MLKKLLNIIQIFFLLLTLVLLISAWVYPEAFEAAISWIGMISEKIGYWAILIMFIMVVIESLPFVGAVLPGTSILFIVGGFFLQRHFDLFFPIWLLLGAGGALGNAIGYFLGSYVGRDFLEQHGHWMGVGTTEMDYVDKLVAKGGFWFILFAKFHNVFRALIPYIAGAGNAPGRVFWLANVVGSYIWVTVILLLGYFLLDHAESAIKWLSGGVVIIMLAVLGYFYFFKREVLVEYMRKKEEEMKQKV